MCTISLAWPCNALPDTQEEDAITNTSTTQTGNSAAITFSGYDGMVQPSGGSSNWSTRLTAFPSEPRLLLSIGFCAVSLQSFPSIAFYYERKEEVKLLFLLSHLSSFIPYEDSNNNNNNFKRYDNFRKKPKDTKRLYRTEN